MQTTNQTPDRFTITPELDTILKKRMRDATLIMDTVRKTHAFFLNHASAWTYLRPFDNLDLPGSSVFTERNSRCQYLYIVGHIVVTPDANTLPDYPYCGPNGDGNATGIELRNYVTHICNSIHMTDAEVLVYNLNPQVFAFYLYLPECDSTRRKAKYEYKAAAHYSEAELRTNHYVHIKNELFGSDGKLVNKNDGNYTVTCDMTQDVCEFVRGHTETFCIGTVTATPKRLLALKKRILDYEFYERENHDYFINTSDTDRHDTIKIFITLKPRNLTGNVSHDTHADQGQSQQVSGTSRSDSSQITDSRNVPEFDMYVAVCPSIENYYNSIKYKIFHM